MEMINVTKNFRIPENPYLLFSPFLIFYIVLILILQTNPIWGDEEAYINLAKNLTNGYYSNPAPNIGIHSGPGYPIILTPFLLLHLPFLTIKLMNAVFYYLSIIFFYKALKFIVSFRIAIIFSLFWACYYNSFHTMHRMHTEIFTSFLIVLVIFLLMKAYQQDKPLHLNKYIYLSGFFIGYLALTKIIFGYVLLVMVPCAFLLWILDKKALNHRKSFFILLLAIITTSPYLIYTYRLTGRIFYWGTTGGNNMYWMSSPYKGEYGNWFPDPIFKHGSIPDKERNSEEKIGIQSGLGNSRFFIPGAEDSLSLHHQKDFEEINKYKGVERDDAYRRLAIRNIKLHPAKYMVNCISNIERILFDYPNSFMLQKPNNIARFLLNMVILVFMILCFLPTILNWRKIIFQIRFMLLFSFLYLGGSVLGSAESRMFTIIAPMILFWIAYIISKSLKFSLIFKNNLD
jgi:4-amino-4-deoxy-L-arabinose transferase-like glycosyltransferase